MCKQRKMCMKRNSFVNFKVLSVKEIFIYYLWLAIIFSICNMGINIKNELVHKKVIVDICACMYVCISGLFVGVYWHPWWWVHTGMPYIYMAYIYIYIYIYLFMILFSNQYSFIFPRMRQHICLFIF